MNAKFNAKVWVVGLLFVGAQATYALETAEQSIREAAQDILVAEAAQEGIMEVGLMTMCEDSIAMQGDGGVIEDPGFDNAAEAQNAPAAASIIPQEEAKLTLSQSMIAKIKASASDFKALCSNLVTFGNEHRMLTALTVAVPAAVVLAYKALPEYFPSIKENAIYKKIQNSPSLLKGAAVTLIPAAVWAWYYTHQVVAPVVVS